MESSVQKIRGVLQLLNSLLESGAICTLYGNSAEENEQIESLYHKTKDALVLPLRNCDVGTAEEQTERMANEYGRKYECYETEHGTHCPLYQEHTDCRLKWAQMPYEAEEGGEHVAD